jgi:hypothetical protein
LDTDFQKYLQLAAVTVVVAFTYVVAASLAVATHQVNLRNAGDVLLLSLFSALVLVPGSYFFLDAVTKIKRIGKAIRNLESTV